MGFRSQLLEDGFHAIGMIWNSKKHPEKNSCRTTTYQKKQRGVQKVHFQNEDAEKAYKINACGLLGGGSKIGAICGGRRPLMR